MSYPFVAHINKVAVMGKHALFDVTLATASFFRSTPKDAQLYFRQPELFRPPWPTLKTCQALIAATATKKNNRSRLARLRQRCDPTPRTRTP